MHFADVVVGQSDVSLDNNLPTQEVLVLGEQLVNLQVSFFFSTRYQGRHTKVLLLTVVAQAVQRGR